MGRSGWLLSCVDGRPDLTGSVPAGALRWGWMIALERTQEIEHDAYVKIEVQLVVLASQIALSS